MKSKQYRVSRIKKELFARKKKGVKEVIWKLDTQEKKEEVVRLGFNFEPWLYEIRTKPFVRIRELPYHLLKDVHYANKEGKSSIVRHLNRKDLKILEDYGVRFRPVKYLIKLN